MKRKGVEVHLFMCVYYFQVALVCDSIITKALLFFSGSTHTHPCFSIDLQRILT